MHGVNDIKHMDIHTAKTLVPEPSAFEVQLAVEKLQSHKSLGTGQIPAELIKAGVEQFAIRSINLLFLSGKRRNCLRSARIRSIYLSIRRAIKQIAVIIGAYHICQLDTKFSPITCCQI